MRSISISSVKNISHLQMDFSSISNFAIIEKMASGKVLIQDGKEISLLKSGAVKKKRKKKQSRALDTQDNFSVQ